MWSREPVRDAQHLMEDLPARSAVQLGGLCPACTCILCCSSSVARRAVLCVVGLRPIRRTAFRGRSVVPLRLAWVRVVFSFILWLGSRIHGVRCNLLSIMYVTSYRLCLCYCLLCSLVPLCCPRRRAQLLVASEAEHSPRLPGC